MVERIIIKNYQSLSDVVIEPGRFTVIVGESGKGKSALIRAVESMTMNNAVCGSDWSYLPYGSSKTYMSMLVDGHVVEWMKGKNINNYAVDGELLKNVGRGCPEEVFKFLKMGEIAIDGIKYHMNIDRQFDIPFLCDSNGSVVAKVLGEITNVNLLISATREANKEKINKSKVRNIREKDLIDLNGEKEKFAQLGSKKTYLELLKSLRANVELNIKKYKELENIEEKLLVYNKEIENNIVIVDRFKNALKGLDTQLKDLNDKLCAFNVFDDIKGKLEEIKGKMDVACYEVNLSDSIKDIDLNRLFDHLTVYNNMVTLVERFEEVGSWVNFNTYQVSNLVFLKDIKLPDISAYTDIHLDTIKLSEVVDKVKSSDSLVKSKVSEVNEALGNYEDFVDKNPLCPVCNKPLEKEVF